MSAAAGLRAPAVQTARVNGDRAAIIAALTDIDTVIASVPGLEVSPADGERRPARLTLRAGTPEALAAGTTLVIYEGTMQVTDLDRDQGHLAVELTGRDQTSGAEAVATLMATVINPRVAGTTEVQVTVEADPGTGTGAHATAVLASVGRRLVEQVACNLEATVSGPIPATPEPSGEPVPAADDDPHQRAGPQAQARPRDLTATDDRQEIRASRVTSVLIALGASVFGALVARAYDRAGR